MKTSFKVSLPFPVIKLNVNVQYIEVKKASGVDYIILTLIHDSKTKTERLSDVLKTFGIAADAHYIFADEINGLIAQNFLAMNDGISYNKESFKNYYLSHFAFTDMGERQFREGYVPTGQEKVKQAAVYFNPLDGELTLKAYQNMKSIDKFPCFPQGFMQSVETDFSDLQDWLLPRQKELGLAPEERITKHEIASQEYFALRYNDCAEFIIEGNAGRLIFGIRGAENFYKKYYTQAMLEQELSQKYAFSFSAPEFKNSISEFALLSNIYAPEKYDAFRKAADDALIEERENSFAVQCGKTAVEIAKTTLNGNLFNKLKNPGSFMVIGKDSSRIYIPGILAIPEQTLEKPVRVQLLVEETDEQIMPYLEAIKDAVFQMPFTPENAAVIKKCSTLARKIWYIDYAKLKLSGAADVNDRVDTLLVLHGTFEPETEWRAFAKTEATAIYQNAVNAITRENCAETVILLEKLRGITGISRKQTVKDIAEIFFRAGNDTAGVFNALFDAKFPEDEVLPLANIVLFYLELVLKDEKTLPESPLRGGFAALGNTLTALKHNTSIQQTDDYTYPENFEKNSFVERYRTFQTQLKTLEEKYSLYAKGQFQEIKKYGEIMRPLFDLVLAERNADAVAPDKINETGITNDIEKGAYISVIALLARKLEYILKEKYNALNKNCMLGQLLGEAKDNNDIPEKELDTLFALSELRNKTFHPTSEKPVFESDKLKQYAKTVFALEKIFKKSREDKNNES